MDRDDVQVGYLLTRREALAVMGSTALFLLTGSSRPSFWAATVQSAPVPSCVVRPQQTEGPYFVDEKLNRSDIRSDPSDGAVKAGALLALTFNVSRIAPGACTPLPGAYIDVWHCDALGVYSDVTDPRFNTRGKKFLRGYQVTDAGGIARFTTIYPGWYQGRTVHIHFKIRSAPSVRPGFEFTSQLYFDDGVTDRVYAQPPYAAKGRRTVRNDRDGIFNQGGAQLLLPVEQDGAGYKATFSIALQGV
jgi:protocatechuate 3,4-dioxygenase beta subunit